MKRESLIVATLIAVTLTASAYPQSNVTMYGVVDLGVEYASHQPSGGHDVVRMTPGNQSGSRWGIRGVEDLGVGLKGLFVLESGFDADTGMSGQGGRLFGRSAYVGLRDTWGELRFGRQNSALFDVAGDIDPIYLASHYSVLVQDVAFSARADNTVKYIGSFGGWKATAMYSFGADSTKVGGSEVPGNAKLGRELGGNLVYASNGLSVTAAYDQIGTGTTTVNPDAMTRRATLAGAYSLGNTTLYAGYRWAKAYDGALLAGAATGQNQQRSNIWWTGLRWKAEGPLTLAAAAYFQDFAETNADPWLFVLSGYYEFSKRTDAYLTVGYTKNHNGSNLGLGSGGSGFGTVQGSANQFGTVIGLRHKF